MVEVDYGLTEEQVMLKEMVRRLAQEKVAPRAAAIDEEEKYPQDIFDLLKRNELLGLDTPVEYGGSGGGTTEVCLAIEELANVCCNSALLLVVGHLAGLPIALASSEEQKQKYLRAIATGDGRSAFCLTEPGAGSDSAALKTTARRVPDGYVINGTKCFITGTTVADFVVVFAKTDPEKGHKGISGFIVDTSNPGFSIGKIEKKMGVRGVPTTEVIFDDCHVPANAILGKEGDGFKIMMRTLNSMRPIVGARGVGLAQGALDYAVGYARERKAFGEPIAAFQGLQFMMADMAMQIETARLMVYHGARMVDQGKVGKEYAWLLSMAKCYPTDVAMKVSTDAVQILGGYGYMRDYPLERFMRDAKQLQIVEGTNQVQRMVIARGLIGDLPE